MAYDWGDGHGAVHSIPLAQHKANMGQTGPDKGATRPSLLPPPPVGTYDPSIDYNAGASQRGYGNTQDDAATAYEQGQQDFGIANDRITHADQARLAAYNTATADNTHQYGILGHQQAEHAAQAGITSAGLLGESAAIRGQNQAHDQAAIDVANNQSIYDLTNQRTDLERSNARAFGGYGGHTILDPQTGQPVFGSLLTGLTRAGTENNAFQTASASQRAFGAAANTNYAPPAPAYNPAAFAHAQHPASLLTQHQKAASPRGFALGGTVLH